MSAYKRIDGDYNITSINSNDNVNVTTNTFNVFGNLDVRGNITYINSTEVEIADPFVTLAANNTGVFSNIGIIAQQTANTYAGLRFNTTTQTWQISSDNVNFSNIAAGNTSTPAGGSNTNIQFNDGGGFGGNGNLTFDKSLNKLTIDGYQVFGNIGAAPANVANSLAVYNNTVGQGGTGLYVQSSSVSDELVSKSKAIVFAIIF